MRPARKGPENVGASIHAIGGAPSFNEAGPQGAGKRVPAGVVRASGHPSMRPARKGPENLPVQMGGSPAFVALQ